MNARTATPAETATRVVGSAIRRGPWMHALAAAVVGIVFGYFLRVLGIAALIDGGVTLMLTAPAVLVVLFAALAFGSVGRAFTRVRMGWLLALTVVLWAPAVLGSAFLIFTGDGGFGSSLLLAPLIGGVVGGVIALLAHRAAPRVIAIVLLLIAVAAITVAVIAAP